MFIDFIKTNWSSILVVVLFLVVMGWLYYKKKIDWIKKVVLTLVIEAEKKLGSGTGELKYEMVVVRVYEFLPKILRIFLTRKQLDLMIEEAVNLLKAYLQEGKNLMGYEQEQKNKNKLRG